MQVYLPGDTIQPNVSDGAHKSKVIGYGIEKRPNNNDELVIVQPGILRSADGKQWMSVHSRRYVPERGDRVLGIVTNTVGDTFKVDIGAAEIAYIYYISFEGATKRNRPNINPGDLLYCTVLVGSKYMEAELTCINTESRARGLGLLPSGGFVFKTSLNLVRRLLSPHSQLLGLLGKNLRFEVTCGVNGRIWIKAAEPREVCLISRIIQESEFVPESNIRKLVEERMKEYHGLSNERSLAQEAVVVVN